MLGKPNYTRGLVSTATALLFMLSMDLFSRHLVHMLFIFHALRYGVG